LEQDVPGASSVQAQDYSLVGGNVGIKKGYFMRIMRGATICWGGFLNLSKPNIYASVHNGTGAAVCRKRWSAAGSVAYDPFPASPVGKKKKGAAAVP
jgi:hypothetical protein